MSEEFSSTPVPSKEEQERTLGFAKAIKKAIEGHHRAGRSVPVRRDGQLVWIGPNREDTDESDE